MNAWPIVLLDDTHLSPNRSSMYHPPGTRRKARVAVFGSLMGGYHVRQELLSGELTERVQIIGVATDDPPPGMHARHRPVVEVFMSMTCKS